MLRWTIKVYSYTVLYLFSKTVKTIIQQKQKVFQNKKGKCSIDSQSFKTQLPTTPLRFRDPSSGLRLPQPIHFNTTKASIHILSSMKVITQSFNTHIGFNECYSSMKVITQSFNTHIGSNECYNTKLKRPRLNTTQENQYKDFCCDWKCWNDFSPLNTNWMGQNLSNKCYV